MQKSNDTLILNLANLLSGRQVTAGAVSGALELICGSFSFDCGLVYESGNSDRFYLTERFLSGEMPVREHFSVDCLTPEQNRRLTGEAVSYLVRSAPPEAGDFELLDLFSASALAAVPVADEDLHIYGLIVFLNRAETAPPDIDRAELTAPLSMLYRYVAARVYRNRLILARTSLERILDNTGIDIYVNDFNNHDILYVNRSMAKPYGGQEQFFGKKCWQVLYPGQKGPCDFCPEKKLIDENGEPTKVYSWDYKRPRDGAWFRVFSAAFRWVDGRLAHVVSSADITDSKQKEALIQYMANYDSLTNLPNRRKLVSECERRIDRATEAEKGYLMFFDIDGFKAINDRFGHDTGDEFLVKLGRFFSGTPMLKNSIYRNGGDEFVAIIGGETITKTDIQALADSILARFRLPWTLKCGDVYCNTSIGVSCFPEDGRLAEELLRKADMAMYQVKKSGGGGLCFAYQLKP